MPAGEDYRLTNFDDTKPGSRCRYSNIGAALAAFLVEAAGGVGFDAWCETEIFQPLGMDRAGWHLADVPAPDVAMPYRWSEARGRYVAIGQYGYPDYPDCVLRTTVPQLARHLGMVMNRGEWRGTRVLERGTVREMVRSQIPDSIYGQGLLWYRTRSRGRTLIGHNGGDKGVATVAFYDRDEDLGVVVLANGNWRRVGGRWPFSRSCTCCSIVLPAADGSGERPSHGSRCELRAVVPLLFYAPRTIGRSEVGTCSGSGSIVDRTSCRTCSSSSRSSGPFGRACSNRGISSRRFGRSPSRSRSIRTPC